MVNLSMDSSVPDEPLPQNSLGKIPVVLVRDTNFFKVHGLTLEPTAAMARSLDDISQSASQLRIVDTHGEAVSLLIGHVLADRRSSQTFSVNGTAEFPKVHFRSRA